MDPVGVGLVAELDVAVLLLDPLGDRRVDRDLAAGHPVPDRLGLAGAGRGEAAEGGRVHRGVGDFLLGDEEGAHRERLHGLDALDALDLLDGRSCPGCSGCRRAGRRRASARSASAAGPSRRRSWPAWPWRPSARCRSTSSSGRQRPASGCRSRLASTPMPTTVAKSRRDTCFITDPLLPAAECGRPLRRGYLADPNPRGRVPQTVRRSSCLRRSPCGRPPSPTRAPRRRGRATRRCPRARRWWRSRRRRRRARSRRSSGTA